MKVKEHERRKDAYYWRGIEDERPQLVAGLELARVNERSDKRIVDRVPKGADARDEAGFFRRNIQHRVQKDEQAR